MTRHEWVEFLGRKFEITNDVLYPRLETESLVRQARSDIRAYKIDTLIDIGTWSWVIPLSLSKECQLRQIYAIDISEKALNIAKKNAIHLNVDNVYFLKQNLLENIPFELIGPIIITANLPYIALKDKNLLALDVLEEDPHIALFGGENGFELYEQLLSQIVSNFLNIPFIFIGEIGFDQEEIAVKTAINKGFNTVSVLKDLTNCPRMLYITNNL